MSGATATAADTVRTLSEWLVNVPMEAGIVAQDERRVLARSALDAGFPGVRSEAWRYTSLAGLLAERYQLAVAGPAPSPGQLAALSPEGVNADLVVVVNGRIDPDLCEIGPLPPGAGFGSLRAMARAARDGVAEAGLLLDRLDRLSNPAERPFSALNSVLAGDAVGLWVPAGVRLTRPVMIASLAIAGHVPLLIQSRLLVALGEGSQATVMEAHGGFGEGSYFCNAVSEFHVASSGRLEHIHVQRDSHAGQRISGTFLRIGRDAQARSHTFTTSGGMVRNDYHLELAEPGAEGEINGLALLKGDSHVDNSTHVEHAAPDCRSHQSFRTILADRSRGIFTGRIKVARDAQRTEAVQSCAALLLSSEARAQARPQLEILADDVKCTHGATVGSLDPASLFYLRSRGIPRDLARRILIHAFSSGQLSRIRTSEMVSPLDRLITRTLAE